MLRLLASIFIDVFGITHPSVEASDRAARYIAFLLLALVAILVLVLLVAFRVLRI
jgi:flagellar biogenesis protein FliO